MENGLPVELGEQELLGSWPEKWRPEHRRVWACGRCHPWKLLPLEEQDVPLLEWAFVMLLLEKHAGCHGCSGLCSAMGSVGLLLMLEEQDVHG